MNLSSQTMTNKLEIDSPIFNYIELVIERSWKKNYKEICTQKKNQQKRCWWTFLHHLQNLPVKTVKSFAKKNYKMNLKDCMFFFWTQRNEHFFLLLLNNSFLMASVNLEVNHKIVLFIITWVWIIANRKKIWTVIKASFFNHFARIKSNDTKKNTES